MYVLCFNFTYLINIRHNIEHNYINLPIYVMIIFFPNTQTYKIIPTKNHVKLPDFQQSYYQIFIVRLRFSVRLLKMFVVRVFGF
jgi:hypothetical protein